METLDKYIHKKAYDLKTLVNIFFDLSSINRYSEELVNQLVSIVKHKNKNEAPLT